jgi:C4-dicarboxylate-specific signal transduction histidine kinase
VMCIAAVASDRRGAVHLYRALLASIEDQVAILDARGVVLEVNESWRRFADARGKDHFDRVSIGDEYLRVCGAAATRGDITAMRAAAGVQSVLAGTQRRFELEYDEDRVAERDWYTMTVESLERPEGGAVVTRANVSASRQARLEIEEQRRELSHLARVAVLGQLSGALAHELSQPLASILSNAEAARHLLLRSPADIEEIRAILQDIVAEDRRAGQVMHRLRAMLARGETRLQMVDAGELVREVLELAHAELITRRVTATSSVGSDLPPVQGDRVQLQQVLLNLILNACEAMSNTVPSERSLTLTARATSTGDVQLSMRDRGVGIPSSLIDRLFEPFVTTKPEGLGLGLSISRAIIAAHGGRLWAENNPDGGATVHCILGSAPLKEPARENVVDRSRRNLYHALQ